MQAPLAPTILDDSEGGVIAEQKQQSAATRQSIREDAELTDNAFCTLNNLGYLFFCSICFAVPERTAVVQLLFGRYVGTITKAGCYCRNGWFTEFRRVSTATTPIDLANVKVADSNGSPLIVSGIVTYEVVDSRRAALDVPSAHQYVLTQAPAVLKRVISQFPYESNDRDVPCLRNEPQTVSTLMRETLQDRVRIAGVRIESFAINELSYAPEIASSMLRRQEASALIDARKLIVRGATDIAKEATAELDGAGAMTPAERSRLIANLLVVLVSDKGVTPVVDL